MNPDEAPSAYLLHEGMGNYRVALARGFDLDANRRLDPTPLFRRAPDHPRCMTEWAGANRCGSADHITLVLDPYHAANLLHALQAATRGDARTLQLSAINNGDWIYELRYFLESQRIDVPPNGLVA